MKRNISKTFDISFFLTGIFILLICISAVSAAGTTGNKNIIYVSTSGNDFWDGLSPTWNGTSGPKATIKNATETVGINGLVYISKGVYTEDTININKNMTITGENNINTLIYAKKNTIFNIISGINFLINNLTLTNNKYNGDNGFINNQGNLTITNAIFTDNFATNGTIDNNCGNLTVINSIFTGNKAKLDGGAISSKYGNVIIMGSIFASNTAPDGGAISSYYGNLTISNSTFKQNIASFNGGAIRHYNGSLKIINSNFNNNIGYYIGGGISCTHGNMTLTGNTFTNNTAATGGAILVYPTYYYTIKSYFTIQNCTFVNNTAIKGSVIYSENEEGTIWFCRILDNGPSQIYSIDYSNIDARYNWWGSNNGPSGVIGDVISDTWLILTTTSDPDNITIGDISKITVDLCHDNHGQYHDPQYGHVPDDIKIILSTKDGILEQSEPALKSGIAITTFVSDKIGENIITTKLDYETLENIINVNIGEKTPTKVITDDLESIAGEKITITSHISDINNNPINQGQVQFKIGTTLIGTANVINGIATLNWIIPTNWKSGMYTITATYLENIQYLSSTGTATLTMIKTSSKTENNQNTRQKPQNILNNHITKSNKYSLNKGLLEFIKRSINRGLVNFEDFDSENEFDQKKAGLQSTGIMFLILLILAFLILIIEAKRKQK